MERKEWEFAQKENRNHRMSDKQWMQRYVYTEFHEILFGEFLIILTEWLEILVENTGRHKTAAPRNWPPELVRQLNYVSNPLTRAVDFLLYSILGGYIIEFVVDCIQSYIFTERDFFKGMCGRFLKLLNT